jgi:hypothetical protein
MTEIADENPKLIIPLSTVSQSLGIDIFTDLAYEHKFTESKPYSSLIKSINIPDEL